MKPMLLHAGLQDARVAEHRQEIPSKWERLGDLALLPSQAFQSGAFKSLGIGLWDTVAAALGVARLARQSPVAKTGAQCSA